MVVDAVPSFSAFRAEGDGAGHHPSIAETLSSSSQRRRIVTIAGWAFGYGLAFWASHRVAALWGGPGFYSLWFPAAGVRLALLWRKGAKFTLLATTVELAVQLAAGVIDLADPHRVQQVIDVARPALAYGGAIVLVRRLTAPDDDRRPPSGLATAPMPFGLAAVLAPVVAALAALPWALWHAPTGHGPAQARDLAVMFASLTDFVVGDLLGVLLVAPPLLWLADLTEGTARWEKRPSPAAVAEASVLLGFAIVLALAFARLGLGLPSTPVLLATSWIGLRFGRPAAWLAVVATAAVVLPWTAQHPVEAISADQRIDLHMALAGIVVAAYLAGSFADAQVLGREALARRDRMLFQAERLKTLRAMSVAVIHEISQPLSTLAIEARHLHELSVSADPEIAAGAAMVDRKVAALAQLVRRLRQFGGRAVDAPTSLPVAALLDTVVALARPEAGAAGVALAVTPPAPELVVMAQEVELAQALVNLVRNAVQAGGEGATVTLGAGRIAAPDDARGRDWSVAVADEVAITVTNPVGRRGASRNGMGIGGLVARTIVEAHGGRIENGDAGGMAVRHLILPAAGKTA